jgi:hypothetical protein
MAATLQVAVSSSSQALVQLPRPGGSARGYLRRRAGHAGGRRTLYRAMASHSVVDSRALVIDLMLLWRAAAGWTLGDATCADYSD